MKKAALDERHSSQSTPTPAVRIAALPTPVADDAEKTWLSPTIALAAIDMSSFSPNVSDCDKPSSMFYACGYCGYRILGTHLDEVVLFRFLRLRPILMQSDRWIEKGDFRSKTKSAFLRGRKSASSIPTFSIEQSDPRIPSKKPTFSTGRADRIARS